MRHILVSKALINGELFSNIVISRDANGRIMDIKPISVFQSEPAVTLFYNGLLTGNVNVASVQIGTFVPSIINNEIDLGYDDKLVLWENISLTDFLITSDTKMRLL